MLKYILYTLILINFISNLSAQKLTGTVYNQSKTPIVASILLKEKVDKDLILEFYESDENGQFNIKTQNNFKYLYIEIRAMGYATIIDSIENPINKIYNFDFILKEQAVELQEIVVKTQRKVVVKKDTTEFYPNAFLNGTERKVEDLLKKLPGMEVSESGKLKYNGKDVESVQLDGDDLFGGKYAIGTKNLPVDIIQKVQAIDNFSANPLLKNIKTSETVSLNLVLKKGKGTINSEIELGLGVDNENNLRNNNSINVLGIKQKIKGFAIGTINNVGKSVGNSDYFKTDYDFNGDSFETQKLLPYNLQNSNLNSELSNINNEKTGSINSFVRISPTLTSKINYNYSIDNLNKVENSIIEYPQENIKYDDAINRNLLLKAKGIDTKFDILFNKKGLLEIENNFSSQHINFIENLVQNKNIFVKNTTSTQLTNQKNKILFTFKVNQKSAFQYSLTYLKNNAPQELLSISKINYTQKSAFDKEILKNEIKYLSTNKLFRYEIVGGTLSNKTKYLSSYFNEASPIKNNQLANDLNYIKDNIYLQFKPIFNFFKFQLNPDFKLLNILQKHQNNLNSKKENSKATVFNTDVNLLFEPLPLHKINFDFKNTSESLNDQNLFINNMWNGNRIFQNNELSLELSQNISYGANYRYHEPFNLITVTISANLNENSNTYLSRYLYDSLFTYTTNFRQPVTLKTKNYEVGLEKFLKFASIKYKFNFNDYNYKNLVNNSELRDNNVETIMQNLFLKSSFSNKFGFENTTNFSKAKIFSNQNFAFQFLSLDTKTKVYYRIENKFELIGTLHAINPNIKTNKYYNFGDLELLLKPKNKIKISNINIQFKNIFNTKFYTEFNNNDFSRTFFSSNLLPRYLMVATQIRL